VLSSVVGFWVCFAPVCVVTFGVTSSLLMASLI
jgi:hypothetical protein